MRATRFEQATAFAAAALAMLITPVPAMAKPPSVAVSLPPLHSLVAAIMGNTGLPYLMVRGGQSPHNAALRPSDLRRLHDADIVVWVGPTLETFLAKPIAAIKKKTAIITLLDLQSMKHLARRAGKTWERHTHDHNLPQGRSKGVIDPHLWLSPINAIAIAKSVARSLISEDPANTVTYKKNMQDLIERIGTLATHLNNFLTPVRHVPYLVFHDAYQYFERHFGLTALGAMSINPERRSGARRIAGIHRRIKQSGVRCVFREPQFPPRMISTIVKGTRTRIGILDPLGIAIQPGPNHWFKLMSGLGEALVQCLKYRP